MFAIRSFSARLLLIFSGLLAVGIALSMYLVSREMERALLQQSNVELTAIANYVVGNLNRAVQLRQRALRQVASVLVSDGESQLTAPQFEAVVGEASLLFPAGVEVVDRQGRVLLTQARHSLPEDPALYPASLLDEATRKGFALGPPVRSRLTGKAELAFCVPLPKSHGSLLYLVGITPLENNSFLEDFFTLHVGESGGLVLASPRDGVYIGASDMPLTLQPMPPVGLYKQHDLAMQGIYGFSEGERYGDHLRDVSVTAPVAAAGWYLVVRMPTARYTALVHRVNLWIVLVSLGSALLILGSGYAVLYHMLLPLRRAAIAARRMSAHAIPLAPLPVERNDEIGHLTMGFNALLNDLMTSREKFKNLAMSDALTGLANRLSFEKGIKRSLARATRHRAPLAVIYCDLNGFKAINDTYGHAAGDLVLKVIAQRLERLVRPEDLVARLGGDEFALLVSDLDNTQHALDKITTRLRAAASEPIYLGKKKLRVGLAVGCALFPVDNSIAEALLALADERMYLDKQNAHQMGLERSA